MKTANAYMVMWKKRRDLLRSLSANGTGQDLGNDETVIDWHNNGQTGRFDAALEEVFHIISHAGYANAYPEIFGEVAGSKLAEAMDIARGGYFEKIPNAYPAEAWYSYNDKTCNYSCMATEYFYWSMTTLLGAQTNRTSEIQDEWRLFTPASLAQTDSFCLLYTSPSPRDS